MRHQVALAVLVALFCASTYAQETSSQESDQRTQQEKDFIAACVANPKPPKECPARPSSTAIPHQPLTDEQKAVLAGAAAQPEPVEPSKISNGSAQPLPPVAIVPPIVKPTANALENSQFWSYQSSGSCFHNGSAVQCFQVGTLQGYASNRQQFEAQFQNGQIIGEEIGILIRAWMEHRQQINLERKDIRQQISTYYNSTFELNDEVMRDQDALMTDYTQLSQLDPVRRPIYEQAEKDCAAFNSRLAMLRPTTEKNLPGILAAKDMKYLRQNLDLAKNFYNLTLEGTKKEYVYSQLMQALVGYYEQHQHDAPSHP